MTEHKPHITIYTDGGADPNPGAGGWGVILIDDSSGRQKELSGHASHATNNRMELTAAIKALEALKEPCHVTFYTDSEYLRQGITSWLPEWIKKNWQRKQGGDVQNVDLWKRLAALTPTHDITWKWVKGHAGNHYNERVDQLATMEIRSQSESTAVQDDEIQNRIFLLVSARGSEGHWAAMLQIMGEEQIIWGHEKNTTSNRLDILAAINALYTVPEHLPVQIFTRSDYLRNGALFWVAGWKKRNWQTKKGDAVKNQDVWEELDFLLSTRQVEWPSTKDEEEFDVIFEDIGHRVQEEIESQQRDSWDDAVYHEDD